MIQKPALSSSDAKTILEAAQHEAQANNWHVSIAVCDEGGHLLAFTRMDSANIASAAISQSKAHTAVVMKKETRLVEEMINQGRTAFVSAPALQGMLEGGVPIFAGGFCVGAVGVSGVQAAQDAQIAAAGIAALTLT